MNKNKIIARELLLIAKELISSDYIHDPEHKKNPGKGFHKTEKGWSNSNGRKRKENTGRDGEKGNSANRNRSEQTHQRSDEFRRIQRASLSLDEKSVKMFHRGDSVPNGELLGRLSRVFRRELEHRCSRDNDSVKLVNPNSGVDVKFYKGTTASIFHDTFEICQKYLKYGDCVDVHSIEDYENCENYLSEDGLSGFSISSDGDLISVYNLNPNGGFLKTIAPLVKEKCKTLDCFDAREQCLPEIYRKTLGFKTAAILDFNYEFMVEDKGKEYADNFVKNHGEAPVHFMVNSDEDVEVKHFNKDQWEEAKAYQESLVHPKGKSNKSSSIRKPINMPWRVWISIDNLKRCE